MLNAAGFLGGGSGGVVYDFYVDWNAGSDANPGTVTAPFKTIGRLRTAMLALTAGQIRTALVRAGNYPWSASPGNSAWGSVNLTPGTVFTVSYELGVVLNGPNDGVTDASWLDWGSSNNTCVFNNVGLGALKDANMARVTGFNFGSGNGLGSANNGGGRLGAHNIRFDNCVDGWSMHGSNENCLVTFCIFENCNKGAVTHVHTGGVLPDVVDCDFNGAAVAVLGLGKPGGDAGASDMVYRRCNFIPGVAQQTLDTARTRLETCVIGTFTVGVSLVPSAGNNSILNDCALNVFADGNRRVAATRCWGKTSFRHRNGGDISLANCHFAVGSTGAGGAGFVYSDFNPGVGSPFSMLNSILEQYATTCVGNGLSAITAPQWVAGPATFDYVWFFNNTLNIDADVVANPAFALQFTNLNQTGTNPQSGSRATLNRGDWTLQAGSPCIGAGLGGADIGFQ